MRFYVLKHFSVREFVPPDYYKAHGEDSIAAIDIRILITMDALRERFGAPIIVNNQKLGFTQRGLRTDPKIGAPKSMHRIGGACDFDIKGVSSATFRRLAKAGQLDDELALITRIEDGTAWNHIDVKEIAGKNIVFIKP